MQLVLIKKFESKKELPVAMPREGRVYRAIKDNKGWNIVLEDGNQLIVENNEIFSYDLVEITKKNYNSLKIHPEDQALIRTYFEITDMPQPVQPANPFGDLQVVDTIMYNALNHVVAHVVSTYNDKYEEAQPMVDNTWLKYGPGKIPVGHNVGQAVSYLKRYCSEGFSKSYNPEDLKKAIHFLLFEYGRRLNES